MPQTRMFPDKIIPDVKMPLEDVVGCLGTSYLHYIQCLHLSWVRNMHPQQHKTWLCWH